MINKQIVINKAPMQEVITHERTSKHTDITHFIADMVSFGGVYVVDEYGYIRTAINIEDHVMLEVGGQDKKLIVYSNNIQDPDVIILNPFSEGLSENIERLWFYKNLSFIVANTVCKIIRFNINKAIEIKNSKEDNGDLKLTKLVSPFMDDIDEKMLDELKIITSSLSDFFNIFYLKKNKQAKTRCGLYESEFKKQYPKIRKKTFAALEKMMNIIFKTESNLSEYSYTSDMTGCPQFEAYSKVWFMCLEAMSPYFDYLNIDIDLHSLSENIKKIPEYQKMARWLVQPTAVNPNGSSTATQKTVVATQTKPWESQSTAINKPWASQQKQVIDPGYAYRPPMPIGNGMGYPQKQVIHAPSNLPWQKPY